MTISTKSGEHGTTNIYFDGGADQHLDPFVEHGKTWIRTVAKSKAVLLKTSDTKENGKRWLSASLTAALTVTGMGSLQVWRYRCAAALLCSAGQH
ncbi:MAG: hypothetical protein ABGX07_17990 [Pirellulaceae bacterium]